MLEFIALNVYNIAIFATILAIIGALIVIWSQTPYGPKNADVIGCCMILASMVTLGVLGVNTKGNYPVSHASWKTIYKNDLEAEVKIAYDDFSDKHNLNTNKKQDITDFQSTLKENDNVMEIKLTATKGDDSITKNVLLDKDNLIAKNIDPTNAYIEKIEYRPIEGTVPKVFGVKGKQSKSDKEGEIRITFKSNTNKQLEALFKD